MDAKKFGTFIASLRKENNMTQADLAKKLQVTDKAISKWERGLGFPDINSIEPLADALGVSILEIMRSEKLDESVITQDTISAALTDTFELVKLQRKAERKSIAKIIGIVVVATGASDVSVRLDLLHAVQTLIGDNNTPIQIFSGI